MGNTRQVLTARTNASEGLDTESGLWRVLFQFLGLMLVMWVALHPATANAQCATPGKDGPGGTLTGVVNTYWPGTTTTVTAGTTTTITLGTGTGVNSGIVSGDLLLIIQMQDATINVTDTNSYGNGVAGNPASGYTAVNSTGLYEFIKAGSTVAFTGGTLTFTGTGTSGRTVNTYSNASFATTTLQGQRRYQVIRVPQYTTATLSSTLTALAWNGTTGGILSIDVSGNLYLGTASAVSVSGLGFRGGAGRQLAGDAAGATATYRDAATIAAHGSKGEGIAGTPRYTFNAATGAVVDNTSEGYTNGSYELGAPGTAGGGGTDAHPSANDENSGGGGGGNGGTGGRGGNSWNSNTAVGGYGGLLFAQAAAGRLVMGGGGGAGSRNNDDGIVAASSAAAGGGMVFIRAGSVSGSATINANGADAFNDTLNDGGGGGGAGGSVLFWVKGGVLTGLTVNAKGGLGGGAWRTHAVNDAERHGPGGGGGGGVVFVSTAALAISVTGGANGITTMSNDAYGATAGAVGVSGTTLTAAQIPGISAGATCTLAPSAVELHSFEATRHENYVELQWQTGYETDNLGYHIYREENGQRQRVTKSLIAGSALMVASGTNLTSGKSYSFWDATGSTSAQYWLEDIDINGTSTWHGPVVAIEAPYGQEQPLLEVKESVSLETLGVNRGDESNATSPVSPRYKAARITPSLLLAQAAIAAQPAVKISVKQEGWYRVTQEELTAAGFNVASPANLQLFVDGQAQPFILNQPKGGSFSVEFYGLGIDTPWSDARVYWLVAGATPATKIRTVQEVAASVASGSFQYTVQRSDRNIYFSSLKNGDADNFFGAVVSSQAADQILTLRSVDLTPGKDATIEVTVQGVTALPHLVAVSMGGVALGTISFGGLDQGTGTFTLSQAMLSEGENHVMLTSQAGASDVSLVASIRVTYWHQLRTDDSSLGFTANGKEQVTLDGFKSADVRVMDVTVPSATQEVKATITKQGAGYSVTVVAPGAGRRSLLAFAGDGIKRAAAIRPDQPSSLKQKANGADLVIITTQALSASIAPLKALRQSQGLTVAVVDVEDIYDEFSAGQKTPQSIKDFLSYAKTNWSPAPRFVLLAGDATYDPRNYLEQGQVDLVPTKIVGTVQFETASDDWFADFDGDAVPEMAVGRLPVRTPEEAATVIGKIVSYQTSQVTNSALLVNDLNQGYDFQQASQAVKSLIPGSVPVVQVDRMVMDDASAKIALLDNLNRGPKLVNFIGHGGPAVWASSSLLTNADAKSLMNRDHLSVYVMMTCLNGLFHDQRSLSLSGALLKSPDGGAVAVWASTGMTEAAGQASLDQEFFKSLFIGKAMTLGEAAMNAKAANGDLDVRRTWILFGDPSMKLR